MHDELISSIVSSMNPKTNNPNPNDQTSPKDPLVSEYSSVDTDVDPINDILESNQPDPESDEETKKSGIKSLISTIIILVIAPLIALTLTAFVFQSYEVDGPSMETTLQNKDRLIVYKLPRTIARITRHAYLPARGDIVIFTRHDNFEFGTASSRQLIKRVIALPGETVVVRSGKVTVYNKENPDGFEPDAAAYGEVIKITEGDLSLTVPEGSIFVLGDNRAQSQDSRAFGPVPLKDVVGKLALRVYPFSKSESF